MAALNWARRGGGRWFSLSEISVASDASGPQVDHAFGHMDYVMGRFLLLLVIGTK